MAPARLFDTRNSQNDIRQYLKLPPKGWDVSVDKKWAKSMDDITAAYLRSAFNTQTSWRFVPAAQKDAVAAEILDGWRASLLHEWDVRQLEQVVLWRLQILHKRERDQWWQERKRRGSKADSVSSSSSSPPSSPAASAPPEPAYWPRPLLPYDPVRDAASCRS